MPEEIKDVADLTRENVNQGKLPALIQAAVNGSTVEFGITLSE